MMWKKKLGLGASGVVLATAIALTVGPAAFAYETKSGVRNCGTQYVQLRTDDSGTYAEHRRVNSTGALVNSWSGPGVHFSIYGTGSQSWWAIAGNKINSATTLCLAP